MDFRDPNTIGMFVYHCHILEHEDKGMMGSIRVDPPPQSSKAGMEQSCGGLHSSAACSNAPATSRPSK
jgi:hypothetical protein